MYTETPIFVFIDGPAPTDEDRALFAEIQADQYLNRQLCEGAKLLPHKFARAVGSAVSVTNHLVVGNHGVPPW